MLRLCRSPRKAWEPPSPASYFNGGLLTSLEVQGCSTEVGEEGPNISGPTLCPLLSWVPQYAICSCSNSVRTEVPVSFQR